MKKTPLLLTLLTSSWLMAGNLVITHAKVQAHTQVFGDSTINPETTHLTSHLKMGKSIKSIRGTIDILVNTLKSDNETRDEHMAKAIASKEYPLAKYTIESIDKSAKGYTLHGLLNFHNIKKPLDIQAKIKQNNNKVIFHGTSSFLMSNYGVTPPKMFFLTVRDRIDLKIDATFKNK